MASGASPVCSPMPSRTRVVVIAAAALAAWVSSQSFTLSLPLVFRVVDAPSQRPVAGALVFALWKTYTVTIAGANPGFSISARAGQSDANGWVHLPMTLAVHRPLAPFSWYARDWNHFPQLLIVDVQHTPKFEASGWFWPYPTILLGSPPVAPSVHLGGDVAIEPLQPVLDGHDSFRFELINDELAFTSSKLSERERCKFVVPARDALLATYARAFPNQSWRDDEFERMLAPCR